jgi:hypothetical protein
MSMTRYICPECGAGELRIAAALELPADSMSDEITVQVVACGSCGARAAAVYEESRRGRLDSDCWIHAGYRIPADRAAELLALIQSCPQPADARCTCPGHTVLGTTDETGRWNGLARWETGEGFPLRPSV